MMTITFDEGNKTISVPQSWSEIPLGNYEKWFSHQLTDRLSQVQYIAGICNVDPSVFLDNPTRLFDVVFDTMSFVFDENFGQPQNSIEINGINYSIALDKDITLAEWVDIESVFESETQSRLSEILSILCRPLGETYNSKLSENRRTLFADLPMDKAMPLLAFFLLRNEKSEMISSLYSQIEHQAALYLHRIRDFAESGAGIKSYPIWHRIKFFFLMKYLKNRLSKFSDSFSTESTKTKRKKNKINF